MQCHYSHKVKFFSNDRMATNCHGGNAYKQRVESRQVISWKIKYSSFEIQVTS